MKAPDVSLTMASAFFMAPVMPCKQARNMQLLDDIPGMGMDAARF
jgi:hypothetical protein